MLQESCNPGCFPRACRSSHNHCEGIDKGNCACTRWQIFPWYPMCLMNMIIEKHWSYGREIIHYRFCSFCHKNKTWEAYTAENTAFLMTSYTYLHLPMKDVYSKTCLRRICSKVDIWLGWKKKLVKAVFWSSKSP